MQLHKDSEPIVESIEENFGIRWEETILLKSQSFQKLSQPNPTTFFQWWQYCPGHIGSAAKNSPSFVFFTCAWLLIAHYQSDWSAKIRAKKIYCRRAFSPSTLAIVCRFTISQLKKDVNEYKQAVHGIQQLIPKLRILNFHKLLNQSDPFFDEKPRTRTN